MPDERRPRMRGQIVVEERIAEWKARPLSDHERLTDKFGSRTRPLDLENLGLETLPDSVRELDDLELLVLIDNRIPELPAWIGELKALRALELTGNALECLPDELSQLSHLRFLWLQRNNLQRIPEALRTLSLETLRLDDNPELGLPESVLDRSPQEILRYYFESQGEAGRPLQELKLLLVGRGKAGKTTLIKRLAGETPNAHESETHSIAIRELTLGCPRGEVQTRAWDFGGQEILHSTHQFFLTERSLYLLVLEPRTGLASKDAEYWLKLIETQGASSPAIVVLNQSHDRSWRVDEVKLRRKFPFIVDFVSADALEGDGVDALHETIVATVENMSDVWLPFPYHWRTIKDAVAGMRGNFLTYRQYTSLCKTHGETRTDAQADLAGILHALGLALYFGNDPRLHDTRVLNPSWVTGGVYAVIRSPSVKQRD